MYRLLTDYTQTLQPGPAAFPDSVRLTRLEAALLQQLRQNPGTCLSRQFLLQTVWGYREGVRSRTLDVHIRRLRSKLGTAGPARIKTIFRDGYCWIGEGTSDL